MRTPSVKAALLVLSLCTLAFVTFVSMKQAATIRIQRSIIRVLWTDLHACANSNTMRATR
jgi:hypothetical protein